MIASLLIRYIVWFAWIVTIIVAARICDRRSDLSKALRLSVFVSPWILIIFTKILDVDLVSIDTLQYIFLLLTTIVSVAISLYSEDYIRILFGKVSSIQVLIDLTLVMIMLFFLARNLVELTILWIIVELLGFLLILFEKGLDNWSIGLKYLILCVTTGDISLFTWLALASLQLGIEKGLLSDFHVLSALQLPVDPLLSILLLIGFITKLGLIPFHVWLIDTYSESPSPSAAIFSGLMSKMGIYAILRIFFMFKINTFIYLNMLLILGFLTTIYGFFMASGQTDIKRLLAYSSMGHYGVIAMLLSLIALEQKFSLMLVYIYVLYHGIVKAQMFLNTGTILLVTNTSDLYRLGYLANVIKEIYLATVFGIMTLIGIPPSIGFLTKFLMIFFAYLLLVTGYPQAILFIIGIGFAAIFSIVYSIKYLGAYTGSYTRPIIRPSIIITRYQYASEMSLALISLLTPLVLILCLNILNCVLHVALFLSIILFLSLILVFGIIIFYRKYVGSESMVWLGGIEA